MYEFEKEKEKKQSEEAKNHEDAKETSSHSLFGGGGSFSSGTNSPTSLNTNLYQLLLKVFKSKDPELIKVMSE